MREARIPVRVVKVELICEEDDCGELMEPTGTVLTSSPPQYPHECKNGHVVQYGIHKAYPTIEYEPVPAVEEFMR